MQLDVRYFNSQTGFLTRIHLKKKSAYETDRVRTLLWTKNQGFLRAHFPFFKDFIQYKKKPLSLCLFSFFHNMSNFILFSVFAPFSLEFYLNYKVSIKIQGLFRSDCSFQGLSRSCIFILKFKDFQGLSRCVLTPKVKWKRRQEYKKNLDFLHLHNLQLYIEFQKFTDYILVWHEITLDKAKFREVLLEKD